VVKPTSTASLVKTIKSLVQRAAKEGRGLKVRASHYDFGSTVPFPCPGGENATGAAAPLRVGVLTSSMKRVLSTNKQLKQMRVGAGMALRDFLPAASRAKLSVPRALLPVSHRKSSGAALSSCRAGPWLFQHASRLTTY
jgi:FAD/FMN-containing dehydrogenase